MPILEFVTRMSGREGGREGERAWTIMKITWFLIAMQSSFGFDLGTGSKDILEVADSE